MRSSPPSPRSARQWRVDVSFSGAHPAWVTPRLHASIALIADTARRESHRIADAERAHRLLRGAAPAWAEPRAFQAAIEAVWEAYPDPAVFRTAGVEEALCRYVSGRRRSSHRKDRSPGALAVRVYARTSRRARVGRALRRVAAVLPVILFGAVLVFGLLEWLF